MSCEPSLPRATTSPPHGPLSLSTGRLPPRWRPSANASRRRRAHFYHRFASRDVLLGNLWLKTILDFQHGVSAALDAEDGLAAALHTPNWSREHLDEARLLLVFDREDFVAGAWPKELRERVAKMTQGMKNAAPRRARAVFGRNGAEERRLAQFLISEVPVAAVRDHLKRGEAPPPLVDRMISTTYSAIVAEYRARHGAAGAT